MLPLAALVDWDTLLKVVLWSLVATVGVTTAFALGIAGVAGLSESRRAGRGRAALGFGVLAGTALGMCVAAVALGIVVMTSKG